MFSLAVKNGKILYFKLLALAFFHFNTNKIFVSHLFRYRQRIQHRNFAVSQKCSIKFEIFVSAQYALIGFLFNFRQSYLTQNYMKQILKAILNSIYCRIYSFCESTKHGISRDFYFIYSHEFCANNTIVAHEYNANRISINCSLVYLDTNNIYCTIRYCMYVCVQ